MNVVVFVSQVFINFENGNNVFFFLQVIIGGDFFDFVIYCYFEQDCCENMVVSKRWVGDDFGLYFVDEIEYFVLIVFINFRFYFICFEGFWGRIVGLV